MIVSGESSLVIGDNGKVFHVVQRSQGERKGHGVNGGDARGRGRGRERGRGGGRSRTRSRRRMKDASEDWNMSRTSCNTVMMGSEYFEEVKRNRARQCFKAAVRSMEL